MQHVPLSDFFPPLLNKHSFVSSSAWKHHFTTINLFCLSFLIALLYTIHSWKLSWQEYLKHKTKISGRMSPIPSWHRKVLSNKCSISPQSDSLCPKQWECVSVAEGQSRRVCFMKERQWGVSSRITAPLDTWQMKMRQQERTRIVQSLYIHHMLSNHSPPVFLKMESMKPIFHSINTIQSP